MVNVFKQAEDLESLEDLHAICSLMQTIRKLKPEKNQDLLTFPVLFNDNSIFEYIMQDDIFMPVVGMLEYDPEYPGLKASYRDFFSDNVRFREVVNIRDPNIRQKIHQTYRLQYLKDVVLARMLDDPTFGILNGFIFFNQVDIVNYIHNNEPILNELFEPFIPPSDKGKTRAVDPNDPAVNERKRDLVRFTHHLILAAKQVQMQTRMNLYRTLLDRGLLSVVAWAFTRTEGQILHAAAETLMIVVEHDVQHARNHILKQKDAASATRPPVLGKVIEWCATTTNLGLLSQVTDTIRSLLETGTDGDVSLRSMMEGELMTAVFHGPAEAGQPDHGELHCVLLRPVHQPPVSAAARTAGDQSHDRYVHAGAGGAHSSLDRSTGQAFARAQDPHSKPCGALIGLHHQSHATTTRIILHPHPSHLPKNRLSSLSPGQASTAWSVCALVCNEHFDLQWQSR